MSELEQAQKNLQTFLDEHPEYVALQRSLEQKLEGMSEVERLITVLRMMNSSLSILEGELKYFQNTIGSWRSQGDGHYEG